MDEETENVINLIFPSGVPDNLEENTEFHAYLSQLGSFRLEQLVKEPERLAEEKAAVLEQTQELAFSNYKTFIQTAECSRAIFQQFKETEGRLDSLLGRLPRLVEQCQHFGHEAGGLGKQRRACSATLARSTALLELLELPQLMELCVAGQLYEEALQLAAFARRLERRHGDIPAIQGVVRDTQAAWRALLQQLLSQLRAELPLPRCLLLVGLLRRMAVFSEVELRLKFLQARDAWLRALLAAVPRNAEHLAKTVELSRQHLFAIVTQYRAAFSDDPSGGAESAILHGWLAEKVGEFVATLEADLALMNEAEPLDSLLNQCMYFGLSLARVGADFRALVAPAFTKAVLRNFSILVRKAGKEFEIQMEKFDFEKASPELTQKGGGGTGPPTALLQFPPLALYCNALLHALNVLRLCAPLALAASVSTVLQSSLSQAAKVILARCRQEQHIFTGEEQRGVQRLCACFADDLVPHVQRCLASVYPPSVLAMHLATPPHQLQKEGVGVINKTEVIELISHLMPVQLEPITLLTQNDEVIANLEDAQCESDLAEQSSIQASSSENVVSGAPVVCDESRSQVAVSDVSISGASMGLDNSHTQASVTSGFQVSSDDPMSQGSVSNTVASEAPMGLKNEDMQTEGVRSEDTQGNATNTPEMYTSSSASVG